MEILKEFIEHVENNDLENVIKMHDLNNLNTRTISQAGSTACELGLSKILEYLLNNISYDPSNDMSFDLQQVCEYGHTECFLLLEKDGRVDFITEDNEPLRLAINGSTSSYY